MPRCVSWAVGRPTLRCVSAATSRCSLQRGVSNSSKVGGGHDDSQVMTPPAGAKMPRMTNRMRRLARAHPAAVAAVSPTAVEDSRAAYKAAAVPSTNMEVLSGYVPAESRELLLPEELSATLAHEVPKSSRRPSRFIALEMLKRNVRTRITREGTNASCPSSTSFEWLRVCCACEEQVGDDGAKMEKKRWSNAELGTPEFFEWLNTFPADAAQRLAEGGDEDEYDEGEDGYDMDETEDDTEEDGSINIGKTFLLPRAKLSPYDQEIFAPSLLDARDRVLEARSPGQLRIAHQRLKEKETALHIRAGNYNMVKVGFDEPAPAAGASSPSEESSSPPQRVPRSRSAAATSRIVYGPSETFAYVYHRMIPAYTVVHRVMTEVRKENPDLNPESMLDFGGGPGTAVSAAWEVWGTQDSDELDEDPQGGRDRRAEGSRLSEVRVVEESQSMKDACKVMLEPLTESGQVKVAFGASLLEEAIMAGRGGRGGTPGGKKFDLVVAAFSLSHLPTHASRAAATAVMWSLVAPGGALVVVEDGSAKGSHTVRSAREMILRPGSSSQSETTKKSRRRGAEGVERKPSSVPYVVGPCRHDKECPLKPGEFCRFLQKVPWNAVNVNKSSVRSVPFSYATIRKGPPTSSHNEETGAPTSSSSVDLLKAFAQHRGNGGGLSAAMASLGTDGISDATLRRDDWARLIRKPLKAKRHALLDVCSPDGNIQRKAVGKGKWKGMPGVFVAARKSELGGLWPYVDDHDVKDHSTVPDSEVDDESGGRWFDGSEDRDDGKGDSPWKLKGWAVEEKEWRDTDDPDDGEMRRAAQLRQRGARAKRKGRRFQDEMSDE